MKNFIQILCFLFFLSPSFSATSQMLKVYNYTGYDHEITITFWDQLSLNFTSQSFFIPASTGATTVTGIPHPAGPGLHAHFVYARIVAYQAGNYISFQDYYESPLWSSQIGPIVNFQNTLIPHPITGAICDWQEGYGINSEHTVLINIL